MVLSHAICTPVAHAAELSPTEIAASFANSVDTRLDVPQEEQREYAARLEQALKDANLVDLPPQYFVLTDRDPMVQAIFIYWKSPQGGWEFIGASPTSTGKPGTFDHFVTPLGVFPHTIANPDFRAEGTRNEHGIRGYGAKGMRIYDLGWVMGQRGWGKRDQGEMRLQMHSTDPGVLEKRLGQPASKGCLRIPGKLNTFIDHYGLIDAEYEQAIKNGQKIWVLRADREPVPSPGRYVVVVDSKRQERPAWLPSTSKQRSRPPAPAAKKE